MCDYWLVSALSERPFRATLVYDAARRLCDLYDRVRLVAPASSTPDARLAPFLRYRGGLHRLSLLARLYTRRAPTDKVGEPRLRHFYGYHLDLLDSVIHLAQLNAL